MDILNTALQSLIVGVFSGGVVYGVLRSELRFLRRDIDEVRNFIWREQRYGTKKA